MIKQIEGGHFTASFNIKPPGMRLLTTRTGILHTHSHKQTALTVH